VARGVQVSSAGSSLPKDCCTSGALLHEACAQHEQGLELQGLMSLSVSAMHFQLSTFN